MSNVIPAEALMQKRFDAWSRHWALEGLARGIEPDKDPKAWEQFLKEQATPTLPDDLKEWAARKVATDLLTEEFEREVAAGSMTRHVSEDGGVFYKEVLRS